MLHQGKSRLVQSRVHPSSSVVIPLCIRNRMASTIVQVYLKQILGACMNVHGTIRSCALQVIQLILDQGLVHPVQIVPYLISLSTDIEPLTRGLADKLLHDIGRKYPGFVQVSELHPPVSVHCVPASPASHLFLIVFQMKALAGVKLSYKLHHLLSISMSSDDIIRGYRKDDSSSLNSYVYSTLRVSRQHRRAFILSLLKLFDEQAVSSHRQRFDCTHDNP